MRAFFITIIVFVLALLFACSANNQNANKNTPSTPTPTPTPTKEEIESENKKTELEQIKAVNDFVEKNYKGWAVQGIANDSKCDEFEPCNLHLTKVTQNKIIAIVLKRFHRPDGSTYWFVYEARPIDLAQAKIEEIKDREKGTVLESLTWDNCEDVCQVQLEEARDAMDAIDERDDYDPYP